MKMKMLLARGLSALALIAVAAGGAYANEKAEPDPIKSQYWPPIKMNLFGDKEVIYDKDFKYIAVHTSLRADDASSVPIMVRMRNPQSESEWVKKITLVVDRNPLPVPGVFTFTKDAGLAHVETRIRVEDMTHVRAVAEMNDGRLIMAARWVKAFGGCSSPFMVVSSKNLGKMKFRMEDDLISPENPNKIQLMVSHPNVSGLAMDQLTKSFPEPYYVRKVSVSYDGKEVMSADVDGAISENPVFYFYFNARNKGKLQATIIDSKELKFEKEIPIEPGKGLGESS